MDKLKQVWRELKVQTTGQADLTTEEIQETVRSKSSGVIAKLHHKVKVKFYFALFFTIAIGVGLPFAFPLASQVLLLILLLAYLIGSVLLYQEMQILSKGIDMSQDIRRGMKAYHQRIKHVLHYEEVIGLTLYPVSASGGFFLGMQAVDRDAEIMTRPSDWVILVIILIILTISGHLLTKYLNRISFGKYLDQLEDSIRELENG